MAPQASPNSSSASNDKQGVGSGKPEDDAGQAPAPQGEMVELPLTSQEQFLLMRKGWLKEVIQTFSRRSKVKGQIDRRSLQLMLLKLMTLHRDPDEPENAAQPVTLDLLREAVDALGQGGTTKISVATDFLEPAMHEGLVGKVEIGYLNHFYLTQAGVDRSHEPLPEVLEIGGEVEVWYEELPGMEVRKHVGDEYKDIGGQNGFVLLLACNQDGRFMQWHQVQKAFREYHGKGVAQKSESLARLGRRIRTELGPWEDLFFTNSSGCKWQPDALVRNKI